MTFKAQPDGKKDFGSRATTTISVRVPVDQKESILATVKEYVNNFKEDNIKRIKTIQDNIEEIVSIYLDIDDYILKQQSITINKYYSILYNHNKDLIDDLIEKYPVERKTPIKTLTEEKIEKEEKLKNKIEHNSTSHVDKNSLLKPVYKPPSISKHRIGSYEYKREIDKRMKQANRKKRK